MQLYLPSTLMLSLKFHIELKEADIIPVYSKSKFSKENYRPISILLNISKVYKRYFYDQILISLQDIFS